jgi:HK97 family phage major capsid protein
LKGEREMNNLEQRKAELSTKMRALTDKKTLSSTEKVQLQALMSEAATIRDAEERAARAKAAMRETATTNGENNGSTFRKVFNEKRTGYVPLNESVDGSGATLVPSAFEVRLKTLMAADGPLYAGSPLITNLYAQQMRSTRYVVSDDLSSTGAIIAETSAAVEAELTGLSSVYVGGSSNRYSSGLLLASIELVQDTSVDGSERLEDVIARAAGARLSRIQNSTNWSALKTSLAANSSAAVSAAGTSIAEADIISLISAVAAPYRINAAFIMSKQKQKQLGALVDSTGRPIFRHVLEAQPTLLSYPVHIINAAAATDCLFGDYSFVVGKSTPVELKVLHERFIDQGMYGYILAERAEAKWSVASGSDSPVKYLSGLTS